MSRVRHAARETDWAAWVLPGGPHAWGPRLPDELPLR